MRKAKRSLMLFSGADYPLKPASDQVEVTLIGPGYGEAVIIHLGDDRWLLIDSCVRRGETRSASLQYLDDIGVDHDNVVAVVASHWDDDHIRGLAGLVEACGKADFVLSKVFGEQLFLAYAAAHDDTLTQGTRSGIKEMRSTLKALVASGRITPRDAHANRRLYGPADLVMQHGQAVEVWTFAPSDAEREFFLAWIASQMPNPKETRRVAVPRKQNDLSTVVFISIGGDGLLFGGDLEEEGRPDTGWTSIVNGAGRPTTKASLFKIAHHGSHNGDHPRIWTDLLQADPLAILAPFKRGKVSLPTVADTTRILGKTPNAFATTALSSRATRRRDASVERSIRETAQAFVSAPQNPGMLRMRKVAGAEGPWATELFGGAVHLDRIHI